MNVNTFSSSKEGRITLCLNSTDEQTASLNKAASEIVDLRVNKNELQREISVTEFANEAKISRQAVVKMISGGKLQAQKVGEQYIIDSEELVRYLKAK